MHFASVACKHFVSSGNGLVMFEAALFFPSKRGLVGTSGLSQPITIRLDQTWAGNNWLTRAPDMNWPCLRRDQCLAPARFACEDRKAGTQHLVLYAELGRETIARLQPGEPWIEGRRKPKHHFFAHIVSDVVATHGNPHLYCVIRTNRG